MGLNYNPTIVPDGLILYLDPANSRSYSGSGNTWYDLSGNSLNATLVNSPSYTVSNRGTFVLDGSSNYFTLPNNSILSLSEFTISIWVKTLQINADQFLIDTSSNLNNGYGYSFRIRSNNTIRFWAYDANALVDTTETISSNVWYHITVSYSNFTKTQKIYINGSLSASAQHTNAFVLADPQYLRIGHSQILGGYSKAVIGQSMFYNRELSASEIKQNYDASKGRFLTPENIVTSGLVLNVDSSRSNSYAAFGNTIYDISGSGNTGTLINGPIFSGSNNGALIFDGVDDYIDVPSISSISGDFTVALWFYSTAASDIHYKRLVDFNYATGFWLGRYASTDTWGGGIIEPNSPYGIYLPFANNQWNYLVSIRRGSTHILYGNGITSTVSNNVSSGTLTSVYKLRIASEPNGANQFFTGRIPQVQMYNRALTQQEILQNYNATKSRFGL